MSKTAKAPARVTLIRAKFPGKCTGCGSPFDTGTPLAWTGRGTFYHVPQCMPQDAADALGLAPMASPGTLSAPEPRTIDVAPVAHGASMNGTYHEPEDEESAGPMPDLADAILRAIRPHLPSAQPMDPAQCRRIAEEVFQEQAEPQADPLDLAEVARTAQDAAGKALVAALATVNGDASALVAVPPAPITDPLYCDATDTGRRIRYCLETGRHALVSGPSGSGKTYPVEQECARLGRALVKLACADGITYRALVVGQELARDASGAGTVTRYRYGALPIAMRAGAVLLLDEADKLQPELAAVFHSVLEDNGRAGLYVPETGETLKPAPGFLVFATSNMVRDQTGVYSGHRIDAAFLNRCRHVPADYLPEDQERAILRNVGADARLAQACTDWLTELRTHYKAGNLTAAPSTRVAVDFCRMLLGIDPHGAPCARLPGADALVLAYTGALSPNEAALAHNATLAAWSV